MPRSTPNAILRARIETAITVVAPVLDLVLAVGDRASRLLGSSDKDHAPARVIREGEFAPRGLRAHSRQASDGR